MSCFGDPKAPGSILCDDLHFLLDKIFAVYKNGMDRLQWGNVLLRSFVPMINAN